MLTFTNALFISDLHLTEDRPDCIRAFFSFLDWIPTEIESLFILGDFFEYWVGDDIASNMPLEVAAKLASTAAEKRIQIFFIAGNRDFSVGKQYFELSNMTALKDNTLVRIGDEDVLLSHGDLLCTSDWSYQIFRKIIRNKWVMKLLLCLSKERRIKMAQNFRLKSKQRFKRYPTPIDVTEAAVNKTFKQYKCPLMIHGHTHLADIHFIELNEKKHRRVVLGDWHQVGWYAKVDTSGVTLNQFSIAKPIF